MFNAESADYDKWHDLDSIIEKLNEAKLPNLKIYVDTISSTEDWLYMLDDEEKAVYEQRAEKDPRDITDYELWYEETYYSFCEDMEYINTEIENYLKEIDDEYGTHYCPTGIQRNFDIISHHKEEKQMPDIEKETLGNNTKEEQVIVPEENQNTDFIFSIHQYDTHAQYMNTQFTLAQLIEAAQSENPFMALRDMGEKPIDSFTVATIEQSDKPFMSVDFNLDNDTVQILNNDNWKSYKISTVTIDEIRNDFEEKSISAPVFEGSFINDEEKMRDFNELSKEEFLSSYSYLTEAEYEATALDVKLFALNTNLAMLNENAVINIESGCKEFNEMAAEDDALLENIDLYEWDSTKNLNENLTECILKGQTHFLYDWIDTYEEITSPFVEGVHLQLAELEEAIATTRAELTNEVDEFRDNVTLNVACCLAIQTGMSMAKEKLDSLKLLDNVVSEFGLNRVAAVVSAEISKRMRDIPISADVGLWAENIIKNQPAQFFNELNQYKFSIDIDKEQLVDFAKSVMKAEVVRDNVQENDTMDELFAQLQKSQRITDNALNPEILNDRRAVEEMKLQSSLAHAKTAFEQQSNTLPILKGLSEIQINKLNNLNAKQTELNNKNKFLVNKGQRLEARAERLENTSQMLKALFPNRQLPKPLQALVDMTAKKAAVIRDDKIPKNNQKIDKNLRRMAKNDRKIEVAQCKVDKYQNMSKVIKSFTVLDSTERKQQFTQGLDGLHNASQRSLQLKLEKCEAKIDKLTQKYMDIETPNKPDIMAKLKAQTEKKNTLTEKIEKLGKLEKPFAEQPENVVDDVMKTAETEIAVQEEAPERMSMEDFADELCAACVDTAVAPTVEKEKVVCISKDEYDKLDLSHKGTLLAEYKYDFSDHDQCWTDTSHIYQLNDRFFSDFTSGYDGKGTFEELTADQMKSKLSDFAVKSGKDKDYSVTEAGKKLLDGKTAEKDKSADKKPSVLGDIKDIKAEQSKEQKNVPEQGQKKARSNEAEI